jgi:hypothetical protein
MNTLNVLLYVKSIKHNTGMDNIVADIATMTGVTEANLNQHIKKMINLTYNPRITTCSHIVNSLTQKGCGSYVIGM